MKILTNIVSDIFPEIQKQAVPEIMASNPSRRKLTSGCLEIGTKGGCLTALTEAIKLYRKAVREKIDHVSTRSNQCVLNRRQDSDVLQFCANVGFSFVSFMD